MKCDELKSTEIYARFAEEVYDDFGDSPQEQEYYRKEHADAAISELKAENRMLKRALWPARATIAHSTKYKYHRLSCKAAIDPQPHGWSCCINGEVYRTGKMNRMVEPHYWIEIWEEVERKCRTKVEEFK